MAKMSHIAFLLCGAEFLFLVILILAKNWKNTFPKEFFNEILLKVGEHEYIYITEMN